MGWAKRGPSGVIATNRADSIATVERLLASMPADVEGKPGARERMDAILRERGAKVVSFSHWEKIEALEHGAAQEGAPRVKITEWKHLLESAHRDD